MRMLMYHLDSFRSTATKKGRSKYVEDFDAESRTTTTGEAILVLASVERKDESKPEEVSVKASDEITKLGDQLGVKTIILHPFAHLFGELSRPETAVRTLKLVEEDLSDAGFTVLRTPFGWFNQLELKAKGHPLSRVARIVSAD